MDATHILTLVADGAESSTVPPVVEGLRAAGGAVGQVTRFDDIAWDLPVSGLSAAMAADAADKAAPGADVAVQATGGRRRKRLLIADMDSTIVVGETLDDLAAAAGIGEAVAAITARAMAGELDFEGAVRARVGMLKGLSTETLARVAADLMLAPGAATLVRTMKASGAVTVLVSGGFEVFVARAAAAAGFDEHRCNRLDIVDGQLSGEVVPPILGRQGKVDLLRETTDRLGLALADSCAVGDGANDLAMIEAAGLGVAFRAKPVVAAAATARVRRNDLTTLLLFQGYRRDAFQA